MVLLLRHFLGSGISSDVWWVLYSFFKKIIIVFKNFFHLILLTTFSYSSTFHFHLHLPFIFIYINIKFLKFKEQLAAWVCFKTWYFKVLNTKNFGKKEAHHKIKPWADTFSFISTIPTQKRLRTLTPWSDMSQSLA